MSHTKEPWRVAEESFDNDGIQESVIRALGGRAVIAVTLEFGENNPNMREANARRIVACVNAVAGVTDEQFDGGWTAQGLSKYAVSLEQQRDELLGALEGLAGDIQGLIEESDGVNGLHLNGDVATWGELEAGGRFERLTHLPGALAAIVKAKGGAA